MYATQATHTLLMLASMGKTTCMYATMNISTHVHVQVHMNIRVHVCIYVYVCVNVYVQVYGCIRAHVVRLTNLSIQRKGFKHMHMCIACAHVYM